MPAFLAPMLASAALSAGQGYMANRAAEQQQKRMNEQTAQNKLITSFGGSAQPQQMGTAARTRHSAAGVSRSTDEATARRTN